MVALIVIDVLVLVLLLWAALPLTMAEAKVKESRVSLSASPPVLDSVLVTDLRLSCVPTHLEEKQTGILTMHIVSSVTKEYAATVSHLYGVKHSSNIKAIGEVSTDREISSYLNATLPSSSSPDNFCCLLVYGERSSGIKVVQDCKNITVSHTDLSSVDADNSKIAEYFDIIANEITDLQKEQDLVLHKLIVESAQSMRDLARGYGLEEEEEDASLNDSSVMNLVQQNMYNPELKELADEKNVMFVANQGQQDVFQTDGSILVYTNVTVNMGNGYNNLTGTFRAPFPGYYMFHYTIFMAHKAWIYMNLMSNDGVLMTMAMSDDDFYWRQYADGSCVVKLDKLQPVHLAVGGVGGGVNGNTFKNTAYPNRFNGYMLKATL